MIEFQFDRCQSGPQWFWCVEQEDGASEHGWAPTEQAARSAARSAMRRITNGAPFTMEHRKGLAERMMKGTTCTPERDQPRRPKKPRPTAADRALWEQLQAAVRRPAPQLTKPGPAELAELRAAMVNAHPDRGGSSQAFIEARRRYLAAKTAAWRRSGEE